MLLSRIVIFQFIPSEAEQAWLQLWRNLQRGFLQVLFDLTAVSSFDHKAHLSAWLYLYKARALYSLE